MKLFISLFMSITLLHTMNMSAGKHVPQSEIPDENRPIPFITLNFLQETRLRFNHADFGAKIVMGTLGCIILAAFCTRGMFVEGIIAVGSTSLLLLHGGLFEND